MCPLKDTDRRSSLVGPGGLLELLAPPSQQVDTAGLLVSQQTEPACYLFPCQQGLEK